MTLPLRRAAEAWLAAGTPAIEVEVLRTRGSVPRDAGTRMLVAADALAGSIGGGHLEWRAVGRARECLRAGIVEPQEQSFTLGAALGQCCGGVVTLRLQRLTPARLAAWPVPATRFELQLHGAGHVGRAIARLLAGIDCRVQWIDEREAAFPTEPAPSHIERLAIDEPAAEVAGAPVGAAYLVLTHSHDLDLRIVEAVLRRGEFGYLGLIGSATKRARFEHRLRDRGIGAETIARLTCPVGIAGITGKEPEVIAVAVVAQLLQLAPGDD